MRIIDWIIHHKIKTFYIFIIVTISLYIIIRGWWAIPAILVIPFIIWAIYYEFIEKSKSTNF